MGRDFKYVISTEKYIRWGKLRLEDYFPGRNVWSGPESKEAGQYMVGIDMDDLLLFLKNYIEEFEIVTEKDRNFGSTLAILGKLLSEMQAYVSCGETPYVFITYN